MTSKRKIDIAIATSAAMFVVILQVASYMDHSIMILHLVEALPYIIGPVLCFRGVKLGYMVSFSAGIFWIWSGGFLTSFIRNGFEQLAVWIESGAVDRPDILIAVPAAIGTGGMALFSLVAYLGLEKKSLKDLLSLLMALVLITVFFLAIFWLFAPGYLEMFRGIL